jgi:dolichol-phosphate mannosyltransferase
MASGALRTLICVPTYNERENIEPLARLILEHADPGTDILFVDDGSPDGTGFVADDLAKADSRIHVMHRRGKLGLATAYMQAFQWGMARGYDWFFEMDADFSHDPRHLPAFFALFRAGTADVVCGSRYVEGGGVSNWSRSRLMLSRMGSIYSTLWLRHDVQDWTGGFNAWNRATVEKLRLATIRSKGYAFQIEMKYRALTLGARLVEVPIVFQERRAGTSKMSGSIVSEAIVGVAKLRLSADKGELFTALPGATEA